MTDLAHVYLDLDGLFSADELALRDRIREFVRERITPNIAGWYEAGHFPRELVTELGALGVLGMHLDGYGAHHRNRRLHPGPERAYPRVMLLDGLNHVAVITSDTDRLHAFYIEVFGARVVHDKREEQLRFSIVDVGPHTEFNVFELPGDGPPPPQTPIFGRGRLDHIGLQAASLEAFEEIRRRLLDRGCCDEFVTDFGQVLSLFFRDPDGLEAEVCVPNPEAVPGVYNPPGTPAARFVSA